MTPDSSLPYHGLRVLDISQGIAGPYCAQILSEQGADVIKVEPPSGDWGRFIGVVRGEQSALSIQYNAGKRAVAIDARQDAGKALLRRLADRADVIVQNFRPGIVERMGLGYQTLAAQRPELVYVSISGYGADGPYRDAPATDSVMQADSGLMVSNQDERGTPRRIGVLVADAATGLYAAQAVSAALYKKAMRGTGSHVEVGLFEACVSFQSTAFLEHQIAGKRPSGAVSAPNGVFDTADGKLTLVTLNNEQFANVCRALERTEWLDDARFADNASRVAHRAELHADINALLGAQTAAFWMDRLKQHDVLHAPVRDYDAVMAHPQAEHLQMFKPLAQPGLEGICHLAVPASPFRRPVSAAPRIGEHSVQVLLEAGMDAASIQQWMDAGVVMQATDTTIKEDKPS